MTRNIAKLRGYIRFQNNYLCFTYRSRLSLSFCSDYKGISSSADRRHQHQQQNHHQQVSITENTDLLRSIPLQDVRNFCIIAHIDHGKSSLSSRILELTGNLGRQQQKTAWEAATSVERRQQTTNDQHHQDSNKMAASAKEQIQLLDTLSVEQQRGITVKASTATMLYRHPSAVGPSGVLLLNLYDTPGHADFGMEVTRSLSFVQGAVLLLDATQGIQAQTWSVYDKVRFSDPSPELIIALTKVDLDAARPVHVALSVSEWFDWDDPDSIILTSARSRIGIKELLDAVCQKVPPPKALQDDDGSMLRVQVVDSWYDSRGVNCLVQVVSGELKEGDRISILSRKTGSAASSAQSYPVQEVGILLPHSYRTGFLLRGQQGYVRFGLRDPREAMPGTILIENSLVGKKLIIPTMPKETATKSVLYASVHPQDADGFEELCNAVDRLALNDTGLEVQRTASIGNSAGGEGPFLGPGLRVGFQGLLHVEVARQRLLDEFGIDAVVTPPKVPYTITILPSKNNNLQEAYTKVVEDLSEWPEPGTKFKVLEPMVSVRILARVKDAGAVMELLTRKRATDMQTKPMDEEKWLFKAEVPWAECVTDFHDQLKNVTAGYGSMDTSDGHPPWKESNLSKVDICLNGEVVGPLAFVCHVDAAQSEGRNVCKKLQEALPRQQFVIAIQAKANGKIIASERIKAYRKDVLTKSGKVVGGGDQTRKMKLLEKQKKGKKKMQQTGKVTLSQSAFNSVISRSS